MKVVVLCGGLGMRLYQETEFRPKPMIEIGGRPILWHIMKTFGHHDVTEFVLALGYRGNMIKEHFLNYEPMNNDFTVDLGAKHRIVYHGAHEEQDLKVTLVDTGLDVSTGARVARVRRFVEDEPAFVVTYGDGVSDVNVRRLLEFHAAHRKIATVTTVRPSSRYGVLEFDAEGKVERFAEKPQLEGWVNIGYFVFGPRVFDYLSDDRSTVLEGQPLEALAADGQLMAYRHEGFFQPMDTYREFQYLNDLWDSGRAPWKVWGARPSTDAPSLAGWVSKREPLAPETSTSAPARKSRSGRSRGPSGSGPK